MFLCCVIWSFNQLLVLILMVPSIPAGHGFQCIVMWVCERRAGLLWRSVLVCVGASGSGVAGNLPLRVPPPSSESEEGGLKVVLFKCNVHRV